MLAMEAEAGNHVILVPPPVTPSGLESSSGTSPPVTNWRSGTSRSVSIPPILCINVGMMVIYSFVATTMGDAAKSKPWMGFFGLFSACLATLAGFGFCFYAHVEWITLTLAAPFLLFGLGMDDTFVMLSAWRRSPSHMSVPERMGKAYAEAGISITFTSLTNCAR